jgi:glycosyltransferase involved in cell wall biosynthesis
VGRSALAAEVRAADVVTAIAETTRRRVLDLVPEAAARVRVVRCGVDVAHPPTPTASTPRFDVVAVGSLVPRKGHDGFVRAVARLAATRPGVRAAIVGEGPERPRLAAAIAATGAPVTLLGALPEAAAGAVAAAARVAALACRRPRWRRGRRAGVAHGGDGGGGAGGLDAGRGIAELLDDGRAGLLVAPDDAAGLASAVGRLLDDPALAARLAAAGRAAVRARHDLSSCARDLVAALGVAAAAAPAGR